MYDSTVQTISFDEIRVRYRQLRREIIREIILQDLTKESINKYVLSQALKQVKEEDRDFFFEDVMEDLKEIDPIRIVFIGITPEQLTNWLKKLS